MSMKVLVNASNLRIGGGIQKAVQFYLACCVYGSRHNWRFILSPQIVASLDLRSVPEWISIVEVNHSPAKIIAGRATRKLLKMEERLFKPDVVFSVSGPCYHLFTRPHLMGFAIGWITHPSALAWKSLKSIKKKLFFFLRLKYYAVWARFADEWLFQTETAARGFAAKYKISHERTHVVPNSCSDFFFRAQEDKISKPNNNYFNQETPFRLLVITSYKAHKNLDIIPDIAAILNADSPSPGFHFVFTIKDDSLPWQKIIAKARRLGVEDLLSTVGSTLVKDAPALFETCHAVFLPTVLETFSATYPEAMCMELPIITSDLDFAQEICGDAAIYFNPTDAEAAAATIKKIAFDSNIREKLIRNGLRRLPDFGTSHDRFQSVQKILEDMVLKHGKAS